MWIGRLWLNYRWQSRPCFFSTSHVPQTEVRSCAAAVSVLFGIVVQAGHQLGTVEFNLLTAFGLAHEPAPAGCTRQQHHVFQYIWFQDEARIGQKRRRCHVWWKRGELTRHLRSSLHVCLHLRGSAARHRRRVGDALSARRVRVCPMLHEHHSDADFFDRLADYP